MLSEGTLSRGWQEIAEGCEDRGIVLSSSGGLETAGVGLDCLQRDWRFALSLLAELVREPAFPEDRFEWVVAQGVAELESIADQPGAKTMWGFNRLLYGGHAAGRPRAGTRADLERLTAADCRQCHLDALSRGGVLAITGLVDEEKVGAVASELFAGVVGDSPAQGGGEIDPPATDRCRLTTTARDQAHLLVGQLTVPRAHPDVAALDLVSVILGSGSGLCGRIPERVREREGLAYSASASAVAGAGLDPGRLVAHVGTSPDTCERAELCVREELERLVEGGVDDRELEEARAYLLGREPFRRETPRQWADLLGLSALYGLPFDDPEWMAGLYRSLGRDEVEAAARRHVRPGELRVAVGEPRPEADEGPALC
jgi:zinc protease